MIRLVSIFVGLGFAFVALFALGNGVVSAITEPVSKPPEYKFHLHPRQVNFSFEGPFARWDLAQLQRGYKVYKEVCAACHSLNYVAFRNLAQLGYDEGQVRAEAASWQVPGIDPQTGEATTRPGLPTDNFPSPYPNDVAAAAANNNAIPPDLSLITKARHDGADYVYSLLVGYADPATFQVDGQTIQQAAPEFTTGPGLHFNPYFPNLNIAMAPPLTSKGQVTFDDGTEATISQMSQDVAAFLMWTAEPSLIHRKQTGWAALGFVLFATVLAYLAKQQIWAPVKPEKARRRRAGNA
ncbi:cytochrome c1 [Erythrobacteraceae bacterium CFH 75059]|uniref:cytochrome c1 n=1 Tax=Qipengyuania thermophila TaxID=2509361 RepID=UPI00102109EB|nr:cytochrome c1 [Qipengyuania thermophila]TCD06767.1 cytochrome c1 [Erythrobacteraceae bacterium CFH 75059]